MGGGKAVLSFDAGYRLRFGQCDLCRGKMLVSQSFSKAASDDRTKCLLCKPFFDTPLRIVSGDKLFDKLPFDTFIQFLIRRISLLTKAYTDFQLEWKEEELLNQARKIKTLDEYWREVPFIRYSMNQKDGKLKLSSRTGWILYEGDLSGFVPILEAGKYLRVGKGATIGFGHYDISYDK